MVDGIFYECFASRRRNMKKGFCVVVFLMALIVLYASSGPVLAFTITGDLATPGVYNYSGLTTDLWSVLSGVGGVDNTAPAGYQTTGNYQETDYVSVTGANGAIATFSVGEIDNKFGQENIGITNNGGVYSLSYGTQAVSNITNINVVHAPLPPGPGPSGLSGYPGGKSASFTVSGAGVTNPAIYTPDGLLAGSTALSQSDQISAASNGVIYMGASLLSLLNSAGVNTNNMNQVVVAAGSNNYEVVMSMAEIVAQGNNDLVADASNDGKYYYDLSGDVVNGSNGFARTVLGAESQRGLWNSNLESLTVVSTTPVPPSLALLVPGLLGLFGMRRRFI
jgi:hypothetical protein